MSRARLPLSIRRLQQLGFFHGLELEEAWRLYDTVGRGASVAEMLRLFYAADGDVVESLWRRQSDGYAEFHRHAKPQTVATALKHAIPDIGHIRLALTREALAVSNHRHTVTVSQVVRHSRLRGRTHRVALKRPRHVVQAVNALLAYDDHPRRFVELSTDGDVRSFVCVDASVSRTLLDQKASALKDIEEIYAFARWDRAPDVRAVG